MCFSCGHDYFQYHDEKAERKNGEIYKRELLIKKERKIMKKYLLCALFMLFCAAGCSKSPEEMISEQLSLGNKYLAEENYEEAIIAFEKVLELDPKQWEAHKGLIEIERERKNYETAFDYMKSSIDEMENGLSQEAVDYMLSFCQERLNKASTEGNMKLAITIMNMMLNIEPGNTDIKQQKEAIEEVINREALLKKMAENIVGQEDYSFEDSEILSDEFQTLIADLDEKLYINIDNGNILGIYPGGYIYYGEEENGLRNGMGTWYYGSRYSMIIMKGVWKNDKPEGIMEITDIKNMSVITREPNHTYATKTVTSCRIENGLYEGNANVKWYMEDGEIHDWDVQYHAGSLQGSNGIAAICKNCPADLLTHDSVYKIKGIE